MLCCAGSRSWERKGKVKGKVREVPKQIWQKTWLKLFQTLVLILNFTFVRINIYLICRPVKGCINNMDIHTTFVSDLVWNTLHKAQ